MKIIISFPQASCPLRRLMEWVKKKEKERAEGQMLKNAKRVSHIKTKISYQNFLQSH